MKYSIPTKLFTLILIAAICLSQGCASRTCVGDKVDSGQECPQGLRDWISVSFPKTESDEFYAANYSEHEWEVYSDSGVMSAKPYNPDEEIIGQKPPFSISDSPKSSTCKHTIHVMGGWIIGYNKGEWGGNLWWFSEDGRDRYKIADDQINGFLQTPYGVYGFEGMAHLGLSEGGIVKIMKDKTTNKWRSILFVKLNEAPYAATLDKNASMIVVTSSGLVRVSSVGQIEILVKDIWGGLYPNSIIMDSGDNVYIGMRQGVAKISIANPSRIEWLVANRKILKDDFKKMKKFLN